MCHHLKENFDKAYHKSNNHLHPSQKQTFSRFASWLSSFSSQHQDICLWWLFAPFPSLYQFFCLLGHYVLCPVLSSFIKRFSFDKDFSAYLWRRSNSGSFWILPCWKISLCFARCSSARFLASSASFCLFARAILAFSSLEINFGLESSSSLAFLASMISSSERGVAF